MARQFIRSRNPPPIYFEVLRYDPAQDVLTLRGRFFNDIPMKRAYAMEHYQPTSEADYAEFTRLQKRLQAGTQDNASAGGEG